MSAFLRIQLSYVSASAVEIRVEESARGEPRQVVEMPLQGRVQTLLKLLEAGDTRGDSLTEDEAAALRRAGILDTGRPPSTDELRRRVGHLLFDALFPAGGEPDHDVRAAFVATLAQAGQQREPMALQLRFDRDAVDLASLPWELLSCDEEPLVASGRVQLTRYITFAQTTTAYPVTDHLEVLTITARPRDALTLDPAVEVAAIRAAFDDLAQRGIARIHPLSPPTPDALAAAVNAHTYHIIHFDGHGMFGRRCPYCGAFSEERAVFCTTSRCGARLDDASLEGCLLFESNKGDGLSQMVSPPELGTILTERQVRLFIASACQSGAVKGASVFNSIGPRLLLAGIPAVVAMQFAVPVDSTVAFSSEFYAALARSESVAAATSAGRRILVSRGTWHIPALYLRSRDGEGKLFRFRDRERSAAMLITRVGGVTVYLRPAGTPEPDWSTLRPRDALPYKFLAPYETTDKPVFFGREAAVRELTGMILQRTLTILHGPAGIGKTSLVNAGLVPRMLDNGYLVVVADDYADLASSIARAAARSAAPDMDPAAIDNLPQLVQSVVQSAAHPLLIVLDHFEAFLSSASNEQRRALLRQIDQCAGCSEGLPVRFLIVVREDFVGRLTADGGPGQWLAALSLGLLTRDEARAAIEGPLEQCEPPMCYESTFLEDQLLPDLSAEAGAGLVNPTHLQIVCHEICLAALQEDARVITARQYPAGGTGAILARYLDQSLTRCFPDPVERDCVRNLLKLMASAAGELVFITAQAASQVINLPPDQVQATLETLRSQGLVERRDVSGAHSTYSVSHHLLADEIAGWFDRAQALDRCAQETLDRAWEDWYAQWTVSSEAVPPTDDRAAGPEFLVDPTRLAEIRSRRERLRINGPQLCLLLHSAVHQQLDAGYWAHQLAQDGPAKALLEAISQEEGGHHAQAQEVCLAAAALGLQVTGDKALAKAATGGDPGHVRHSAALALAAAGMDAVREGFDAMEAATPRRRNWRKAQALAQIKAAGFPLPQVSLGLQALVAMWSLGLCVWDSRWYLVAESLLAGLGASIGLGLALLVNVLGSPSQLWPIFVLRSLLYMPIGFAIGTLTVAVAWVVRLSGTGGSPRSQAARQVIGVWLGFVLGLLFLWWPLDSFGTLVVGWAGLGSGLPPDRNLITTYLLGGSLWGLGIATGYQLLAGTLATPSYSRALIGAGAGGAVGCLLAWFLGADVPLAEPAGRLAILQVALAGFGLSGGLALGRVAGAHIWLQLRQGRHWSPVIDPGRA